MDGARIFNACAELKIEPRELVKDIDSVMFCLSKGLCAPMGSVVVGSKEFIERFNHNRRMLGGMFRKPGMVAQMGIISLTSVRMHI
jgi:threonine aldolase